MLVAAAVCPHPPLLIPEVASGAAHELDGLRAACDKAVATLLRAQPDVIVVVGAGTQVRGSSGTFAPYGVPLQVGSGAPTLPLPHSVGCWLLDRAEWTGRRTYIGTDDDAAVTAESGNVALLVMGDASARRTEKAPGYIDARAADYDATVAQALRTGPQAVMALDGDLAEQLLAAGWSAWQLLARVTRDSAWTCELLYDDAPYGVGYLVATWQRA
jgi:aromatic ring-opening dioxygenase LigB subunit